MQPRDSAVGRAGGGTSSKAIAASTSEETIVPSRPFEVLIVGVVTVLISLISALIPAYEASSLRPVEGLRYD